MCELSYDYPWAGGYKAFLKILGKDFNNLNINKEIEIEGILGEPGNGMNTNCKSTNVKEINTIKNINYKSIPTKKI